MKDNCSAVRRHGREIWFYGEVDADSVADLGLALAEAAAGTLNGPILLHVCSSGGWSYAGQAGHSLIRRSSVPVHVLIEGCCESAAAIMALGATRRLMDPLAIFRVHRPVHSWVDIRHGEQGDLVRELERLHATIVRVVAGKMGEAAAADLVGREAVLSADEALEAGLVDEVLA